MRILGIDPGSSVTGYGVVERVRSRVEHRAHGTLRPPRGASLGERLAFIHAGLGEVVAAHAPDLAVVERVFVATSVRSALVLGHARGAALAALGVARVPVEELSAGEVKQGVVGSGAAAKAQVQAMVARLLGLDPAPAQDAADALAAALCRAHRGRTAVRGGAQRGRGRARGRRPGVAVRRAP